MNAAAVLLVTWFYYGQAPAWSQTPFTSMAACQVAREAVLCEAVRLKADWDKEVVRKAACQLCPIPGCLPFPRSARFNDKQARDLWLIIVTIQTKDKQNELYRRPPRPR
jgi:hypothetical protein